MANREHDGAEHVDARPLPEENGSGRQGTDDESSGHSAEPSPAEQWFGDGAPMTPPPPPYAQAPDSGSTAEPSHHAPYQAPSEPSQPADPHTGGPETAEPQPASPWAAGAPADSPPVLPQPEPSHQPAFSEPLRDVAPPAAPPPPPAPEELGDDEPTTVQIRPVEQPERPRPNPDEEETHRLDTPADQHSGGSPPSVYPSHASDDVPDPEPLPPLEDPPPARFAPPPPPKAEPWSPPSPPPPGAPQYPRPRPQAGPAPYEGPGRAASPPPPPPQGWRPRHGGQPAAGPQQPPGYPSGGYPPGGDEIPPPPTADSLQADLLVRGRRHAPAKGWRKAVYNLTFGMVHPGESQATLRQREQVAKVKTPVAGGHYRLAVLSLKGGVGKTTTTVALGSMLASLRGDRVLAVDANPDRGTLSDKVHLETRATIRDLLNEKDGIQRYADFRAYTSQAPSRLEVLASDRDPAVSEAFSEEDYRHVARILEHYYSICITDCGTGLLHSAMRGVLGMADQIVLVSSPSVDGARSASATLDWLDAHEYRHLVHGAVVVLSMVRPKGKSSVDLDQLEDHFRQRCREVVRVPWDPHLEEGAEMDLDKLLPNTREAYLKLAASVGEAFAWPR